jgi:hypothetical protein
MNPLSASSLFGVLVRVSWHKRSEGEVILALQCCMPCPVHEDSERRLWFEIGDKAAWVQHYIAVPSCLSVCAGVLEIHTATTRDAQHTTRRIANGIGPVAAERRPDANK